MKLTLQTEKLQDLVARAVKGCSNDKMLPITCLMLIRLENGVLTLITTDANNYVYIRERAEGDDFYVVVQAETFSKLISKMTSETTSLELVDGNLVVTGNGKYTIDLPLDEEGQFVKFPDPLSTFVKPEASSEISLHTIKLLLGSNKSALLGSNNSSMAVDIPCYTGYYVSEDVISTDTYVMCSTGVKLFDFDDPVLISSETLDRLDIMTNENITAYYDGDSILVFETPECVVYGKTMPDKQDFAIDAIRKLIVSEYTSKCTISRNDILQVLDRLSLFVGPYDKNGINMTFTKDGIVLSSLKSSGVELVPFKTSENFADFTCCISVELLQKQIKSHEADSLELWYGRDNALKIVDGPVTQIIAYETVN